MRAGLLGGFLISGLLVLASGCGEAFVATGGAGGTTTTTTGGAGGGGTGGAGGQTTTGPACTPLGSDQCNECLVDACAEPYCKCAGSSDCIDMGNCMKTVQSVADLQNCWKDHKDSISLVGQIQVCGNAHCDACGFPAVEKCLACEYKQCPNQTNDCLGNPKCVELGKCLGACVGKPDAEACQSNCLSAFPDGVQPAQALTSCAAQLCPGECG